MNANQLSFIDGFRDFHPKRMAVGLGNMLSEVFACEQSPALAQQLEAQCALLLWGFLSGSAEHHITVNALRCGLIVSIAYIRNEGIVQGARIHFDVPSNESEAWATREYVRELEVPRREIHAPCPLCGEDGWTHYKIADAWKRPYLRAIRDYTQSLNAKWTPITSTTIFTPDEWETAWKANGIVRAPQSGLDQYPPKARRLVSTYSLPETAEFGGVTFSFLQMASELYAASDGGNRFIFGELTFDGGATLACLIDSINEKVTLVDLDSPDGKQIYVNIDLETFFRSLLTAVQWKAWVDTGGNVSPKDINALKAALKDLDATAFKSRNRCFWPILQPFSPEFFG
jgi:hypothetical protein